MGNNIKDFILAPVVEEAEQEEEAKVVVAKPKPVILFETIAETEIDFVIKRTGKRSSAIMAIIPSKGQYYMIRDDGDPETLTVADMVWFMSAYTEDAYPINNNWIKQLERGKRFAEEFLGFLEENQDLIKAGFIKYGERRQESLACIYAESAPIAKHLAKHKETLPDRSPIGRHYSKYNPFSKASFERPTTLEYLLIVEKLFGLDNTRKFIDAFVDKDLNFSCDAYYFGHLINKFYEVMMGVDDVVEAPDRKSVV